MTNTAPRCRLPRLSWPAPGFFRARPLMTGALFYMLGLVLARRIPYMGWLWALPPLLFCGAVLLRKKAKLTVILAMLGLAALGLARGGEALKVPPLPELGRWSVEGRVQGAPTDNGRALMLFLTDVTVTPEGAETAIPIDSDMYIYCPNIPANRPRHGERVAVSGRAYLPDQARNPGGFDQQMWLAQQNAHVRLYANTVPKVLQVANFSILGLAIQLSETLGNAMDTAFGLASPMVRAMLIGDETTMPDSWVDWMNNSGIVHLLSVSGLHVALWYALLDRLLRRAPLSPGARWAALAVLLAAYSLVTGLRTPVIRAAIMLLMVQAGHAMRTKTDPLTTLGFAALLLLMVRPLDLFGPSFQLSYGAVLGLVLLGPPIRKRLRFRPKAIASTLTATLSAQFGFLPISARWFAGLPLIGLVVNLAAVPLAGFMIPLAALALALGAVWQPLGWLFAQAVKGIVVLLVLLSRGGAALSFSMLRLGAFAWWAALAYALALFLCCTAVIWRWRTRALAAGLAAALAIGIGLLQGGGILARYVQLDVGQALSGVLHIGGSCYVYDCGEANSDLTEYLLYTGESVDGLFLSHPHSDHVDGLTEVLTEGLSIGTIYIPENATAYGAEGDYEALLALAQSRGTEIVTLSAGDTLTLNGCPVTVIAPESEATGGDANSRSLVLLIEIGNHTLLLCGDADGASEPFGLDCDVLQVAHHGSGEAAQDAFLQSATPDIALISVGRNSYGHPHPDTLARLEQSGAQIYLTQDLGAITVYFERDSIRAEGYLQ
ncbi:MAG: DNA internalization-related competence protein ComEC/Rec2 [Oscillospiraceae bacterium]|jgi:competence protein ComEC|nr:DNA internalization-related competence protein ComEC/Rec2 [Oscillospiraceae bacterium]